MRLDSFSWFPSTVRPPFSGVHRRLLGWVRPVRMRLTLTATALVTIALAIAAIVVVEALHHVLLRSADAATFTRAEQIATQLRTNGIQGIDESLLTGSQNVAVIQILDSSGRIRTVNEPAYNRPMSGPLAPGERRTIHGAYATDTTEEFQTAGLGVASPDGPLTVLVGAAEDPINRTVVLVAILCCIVFPVIVIVMALLTYFSTGRALRPVDSIRQRVEEISGGDLSRRVPVPQTGDEVAQLADTMNAMLGRIEESRQRQLQFVNDASHELNSPLTTLVGLLDLAGSKQQPIDPDTATDVMLPDALRLQHMVADLLLLARADESGVPLLLDDVDLDDLVNSEVVRLEAISDLTVTARLVPTRIIGDEEKLRRALRNIIDNASRHAYGRIAVTMTRTGPDHRVTVMVGDDGPGIADVDKSRVTERFVRLDASRQRLSGGSGLGLSIVSEIVHAHRGETVVRDSEYGGAAVGFTVPVPTSEA